MRDDAERFAAFRILFGAYLFVWFAGVLPYAPEIYGPGGLMGPHFLTPFPNLLKLLPSESGLKIFFGVSAALAILYALGCGRRLAALALWYAWACLINRLAFLEIPSQGYVGWLLLASTLIPGGEPWAVGRKNPRWEMPKILFVGAWIVVALSYSVSGIPKWQSPSWRSGDALRLILENPVARPGVFRDLALAMPPVVLKAATWISLGLELFFAPLCLFRLTRKWAWTLMVLLHVAALALFNITSVTMAMLLVHLFLFDPRWLPKRQETDAALSQVERNPE
ncbi:MAG TPA: HTTM domain-containing protein [bacterium]|nr:HTTM domain-containing protein [bacterium]